MGEKKTKGKQKINIRKVEKNEDRMVTFSKRRNGIYSKLSEISILCGVDTGFLVYSGAGKPYTFGSPSFEAVAERFLNGDNPEINGEGSSSSLIVDAHKKVRIDELCKTFNSLMDDAEAVDEKGKTASGPSLTVESDAWWKAVPKDVEEAKQVLGTYEEFYEKLCMEAARRRSRGGNDGSSSFPHRHGSSS